MLVETKTLGKIDIPENQILSLPFGLLGFEEYKDFAIIESEYKPFMWLQSLEEKNLAFLLIDPFLITNDYEADISDSELAKIDLNHAEDVLLMTIVTVPSSGGDLTANFQGPLVINKRNRKCMQVVLDSSKYTTKHNILDSLKKKGGE